MVWLILGLMAGSLYAIVMGPAGLQTPQTPVSLQTFSLPGFLLGAAVLLMLELLRAKYFHKPRPSCHYRKPPPFRFFLRFFSKCSIVYKTNRRRIR